MMFVLIAYDVAASRRRNKVVKILKGHGQRVNYSVFECEFKKAETLSAVKTEIKAVIKSKKDHVRYYPICRECREKISVQGYGSISAPKLVHFA